MKTLLDVKDLHVTFGPRHGAIEILRGIDLSLVKGETLCLVGESGCGKSMTTLAVTRLLPKAAQLKAARIELDGIDLNTVSRREMTRIRGRKIGMIFQEPMTALNPCFTIGNQMTEAYLHHVSRNRREARERALHLLDRVGVTAAEQRLSQFPFQLSGGLRQRVMIAMALMCEPELLIADEPTTALDVTIQAQILRLLMSIQKEMGLGLLMITHDLGIVSRIADRIGIMYAGQIVEAGTADEIFDRPLHPYTQGLISCVPSKELHDEGKPLQSIPGTVPSLMGGIEGCAFRGRCAFARQDCIASIPLSGVDGEHAARCVLVEHAAGDGEVSHV